jgi:hypothetical protein
MLIVMLLSGCAIPTVIKSKPEGATVYIDNIKIGKTPVTYSDTAILGSSKPIRLEMDGYKSLDTVIRKDQLKTGPLIGACFIGVPGLWALGYAEDYTFELERGYSSKTRKDPAPTRPSPEEQPKTTQTQQQSGKKLESRVPDQGNSTSSASMVVTSSKAKIRKKPSSKAAIVKNLKNGELVQVIKQQEEWYQVELSGGDVGWCHKSVLKHTN